MTVTAVKNVVVVGGSYVGVSAAQQIAAILPATHRVLLVEPHSHFHHLFAFPRFAVVPTHEHKAFIPYTGVFAQPTIADPSAHAVVRAKVLAVHAHSLTLDRTWADPATGALSAELAFDYLALATGTRLPAPGSMSHDDKADSVAYFKTYQQGVAAADKIVIAGGGAVSVQMACDIKDAFPEKDVTVVQSRDRLMPKFDGRFHDLIAARFAELGINLITGSRVTIPADGFPADGRTFDVALANGTTIPAQLVILATGQVPNTALLASLPATTAEGVLNPANGFVRVRPTLQLRDPAYPHMFAVGDVADTGAHKAARPGSAQAGVVARNIARLIAGEPANEAIEVGARAIHMTLGLANNVVFRDPTAEDPEPMIKWKEDGQPDMGIEGVWARRGVTAIKPADYHL
ncbi:hypothetical protein Q5752_000706 [Cryptotrichosporon argae]